MLTTSDDLLSSDPSTTLVALDEPAITSAIVDAEAPVVDTPAPTSATQDWQLQIGYAAEQVATQDPAAIADEPFESLLEALAEDVMEAWLDGDA